MTILCDRDLCRLYPLIIPDVAYRDEGLINPASIDIRVGRTIIRESNIELVRQLELGESFAVAPKEFILLSTYERISVPNGYAVDLRLKSSSARRGFNHSLAFWVDPGWDGILTMEVVNELRFTTLELTVGQRFAQLIVHKLSGESERPYTGRYNNATEVQKDRS